ncbi:hypothetical protein IEQ34_007543 [Dendrobium chrysotoxum]|uniref:Uncharacterized protein n=1 Tax=Dendrobium chrysotoxum TaxID=161865 RepID=A0AAV7H1J8_DENCH|nr:hypothetical protein IEQ34_007543 [Dendrobium chrysotoxum]
MFTEIRKSESIHYGLDTACEGQTSTTEGSFSGSMQYSEYHTWSEAIGGRQKGWVYELSSQAYAYESNTFTSASFGNSGVDDIASFQQPSGGHSSGKLRYEGMG